MRVVEEDASSLLEKPIENLLLFFVLFWSFFPIGFGDLFIWTISLFLLSLLLYYVFFLYVGCFGFGFYGQQTLM
jgi:hypothetical protein